MLIHLTRSVFAAAVTGVCAVVLPANSVASPCIPETMAMSPQPVLSCPGVQPAPFPDTAPVGNSAFNVAGPPPPAPGAPPAANALPAPGQAPFVPPVVNPDGTQSFGPSGYLGDIWDQFHNGVPTDLIFAPPPPPQ